MQPKSELRMKKLKNFKFVKLFMKKNFENNFIVFFNDVLYFSIISILIIFRIHFSSMRILSGIMARSSGLSNFCPCSVYHFSCYPVESTKIIPCVHWNILMPAPTFATRAERVLLVGGGRHQIHL